MSNKYSFTRSVKKAKMFFTSLKKAPPMGKKNRFLFLRSTLRNTLYPLNKYHI